MDKIRDIFLYFVAAMTMFSLLGAVYQAFNDQKASALTLGTLFLVGSLIVFIPYLEGIKMLGVEARLRQTVTEAMASLEGLRKLSAISARATYLQMAWGNRMGTPSTNEKQTILDEIDSQLTELKIKQNEIADIKRPFVQMIALDFYFLYTGTLRAYSQSRYSALVTRASVSTAAQRMRDEHSERITAWTARTNNPDPFPEVANIGLEAALVKFMPSDGEWLDSNELKIAKDFAKKVVGLNAACEKKGGYTAEAASYYDEHIKSTAQLAENLFQQPLSVLRQLPSP